jgi:ribosomal protein S3
MTFDDIKDLSYREVNELLGRAVEEGSLSRPDGWKLINEHIGYHEPRAVIGRLKAEIEDLRAQLKAATCLSKTAAEKDEPPWD